MTKLRDAADLLDRGAEFLREFDEWVKDDGFETFGEWLLDVTLTDEEKPRVIVTPPPEKEKSLFYEELERVEREEAERKARTVRAPFSSLYAKPTYDPYKAATAALVILYQQMRMRDVVYWYRAFDDTRRFKCARCGDVHVVERLFTVEAGTVDDVPAHVYGRKVAEWYRFHGPNCGRVEIERGEWRP